VVLTGAPAKNVLRVRPVLDRVVHHVRFLFVVQALINRVHAAIIRLRLSQWLILSRIGYLASAPHHLRLIMNKLIANKLKRRVVSLVVTLLGLETVHPIGLEPLLALLTLANFRF